MGSSKKSCFVLFIIVGLTINPTSNVITICLEELRELNTLNNFSWILMGDFNIHRAQQDTTGGPINLGIVSEFNNTIHDLELFDIPLMGRKFTWSNKRPTPTFSRLDRLFISPHWNALGASYNLQDAPTTASDHTPLLLHVRPHLNNSRRSFKFENYWLKHSNTMEIVKNAWEGGTIQSTSDPIKKIGQKIAQTMRALNRWAQLNYKNRDSYLKRSMWVVQKLDRAEESRCLNSVEFMLRIRLRENIFKLSKEKEEKWKQRSGATWLKLGDNNTRYFHAVANGRKNQNSISKIRIGNTILREQQQIKQAMLNHYQNLLSSTPVHNMVFDLTGKIGPRLTSHISHLDDDISDEEIKVAVFSMPKGKASGPDGLPIEFFQHFWDIVGYDVRALVRAFFDGGQLSPINKAVITLIPKKEGAVQITDFRPISVINTSAKIITKILANRLQPLLQILVSNSQTAFIKGRSIMESYLVTREYLNYYQKKKNSSNPF